MKAVAAVPPTAEKIERKPASVPAPATFALNEAPSFDSPVLEVDIFLNAPRKNASDVLHHCTVYDLNMLQTGKVVGTTFGKLSLYIHQHQDGYSLVFRRSFADYIWRYLERSALPYGFGIAQLNDGQ